jgi:hypothetical protein
MNDQKVNIVEKRVSLSDKKANNWSLQDKATEENILVGGRQIVNIDNNLLDSDVTPTVQVPIHSSGGLFAAQHSTNTKMNIVKLNQSLLD